MALELSVPRQSTGSCNHQSTKIHTNDVNSKANECSWMSRVLRLGVWSQWAEPFLKEDFWRKIRTALVFVYSLHIITVTPFVGGI